MNRWTLFVRRVTEWSYVPFLCFALAMLSLLLYTGYTLGSLPAYGFVQQDGLIWSGTGGPELDLDPQGPAALAGVRYDDQVLAVDGVPLRQQQSVPYYGTVVGQRVALTVLRDGQSLTTDLRLVAAPLSIVLTRLEPLLIALFFWSISLATWALRPFHSVTRIFFLLGQTMTGTLVVGTLSTIQQPMSSLVFNIFLTLLAPTLLLFFARFPEPLPPRFARPLIQCAYGGALLMILLLLIWPLFSTSPHTLVIIKLLRRSFVALTLMTALVLLFWRRESSELLAHRRKQLITGLLISLLPLLALSFVPELMRGHPLIDYAWTFPFLVLLPVSYAHAMRRGQFGKIDLLINHSLIYVLLIALLLSMYMALFLGLGQLLPHTPWSNPLLGASLAVVVAATYTPLRAWLQRQIDNLFYGGWYNYRTVVCHARSQLSQVHDLDRLVEQLMTIAQTMRFQQAVLLWCQEGRLSPVGSVGYSAETLTRFCVPLDSALVRALPVAAQPLWWDDIWHTIRSENLTKDERALARVEQMVLWLPLVSRGTLHGVLILGQRQSDMLPDTEDLDILATVVVQAALAADNVTLVHALRARLADVEHMRDELARMHRRLAESHEEERRHLARELHDSAVQQLLGVSYQLVASHRKLCADGDQRQREELALDLDNVRQEVLAVSRQLRSLIGELRPAGLEEFGLTTALEGYIARLRREGVENMPEIRTDLAKIGPTLPTPIALCLFRTAQEAMRNALKHAQAQSILLRLRQGHDEVILNVYDDGIGFCIPSSLSELSSNDHFGLIGMDEQINWLNGQLVLHSYPNSGTDIVVRVPLGKGARE